MKLRHIIKLEYASIALLCLLFYWYYQFPWLYLILFLLTPDISMVGYLINGKVGALFYNMSHSFICPAFLLFIGIVCTENVCMMIALIWLMHIGVDRALGYGLKYKDAFTHTHIQHIP
ncbi:DUF4260 domain-containing protein [Lysinibacillus piscis]|uniref:DUF4260 domain-containing protein n=1 Tax=Lysinibacillus piscis TaxID=2518931 RepID=UPI0035A234C4